MTLKEGFFYELGASFNKGIFSVKGNFYQNFLDNLFVQADVEFNDAPSVQFQNIGEAMIMGFEWDFRLKFGALSYAFVSGALISGEDRVNNTALQQIPATQGWIGVHYRNARDIFFIQPEALLVADQDEPAPNEVSTPGYVVFNLRTGLNIHKISDGMPNGKLTFSMTNIFDRAYRSHVSRGAPGNQNTFLEPGRSFNIGLVMRFGKHVR